MKYTLCPPQETPDWAKGYTASSAELGRMLKGGNDLTINQKRIAAFERNPTGFNVEDELKKLIKEKNSD
jgi:hypothetical protein